MPGGQQRGGASGRRIPGPNPGRGAGGAAGPEKRARRAVLLAVAAGGAVFFVGSLVRDVWVLVAGAAIPLLGIAVEALVSTRGG